MKIMARWIFRVALKRADSAYLHGEHKKAEGAMRKAILAGRASGLNDSYIWDRVFLDTLWHSSIVPAAKLSRLREVATHFDLDPRTVDRQDVLSKFTFDSQALQSQLYYHSLAATLKNSGELSAAANAYRHAWAFTCAARKGLPPWHSLATAISGINHAGQEDEYLEGLCILRDLYNALISIGQKEEAAKVKGQLRELLCTYLDKKTSDRSMAELMIGMFAASQTGMRGSDPRASAVIKANMPNFSSLDSAERGKLTKMFPDIFD